MEIKHLGTSEMVYPRDLAVWYLLSSLMFYHDYMNALLNH